MVILYTTKKKKKKNHDGNPRKELHIKLRYERAVPLNKKSREKNPILWQGTAGKLDFVSILILGKRKIKLP